MDVSPSTCPSFERPSQFGCIELLLPFLALPAVQGVTMQQNLIFPTTEFTPSQTQDACVPSEVGSSNGRLKSGGCAAHPADKIRNLGIFRLPRLVSGSVTSIMTFAEEGQFANIPVIDVCVMLGENVPRRDRRACKSSPFTVGQYRILSSH